MIQTNVENIIFTHIIPNRKRKFIFHGIGRISKIRKVNIFTLHCQIKRYYVVDTSNNLNSLEDEENNIVTHMGIVATN
jgi:hypothetical protein